MIKVVSAQEMARLDKRLGDTSLFLEAAGRAVAEALMAFVEKQQLAKKVTLLVGRGNNGGDAYAAGAWLVKAGFEVGAISIAGACSPLNQRFKRKFQKQGGQMVCRMEGVLLDGLLGTGFRGKLSSEIELLIHQANSSGLPILAIDIPSGVDGTTGCVSSVAIVARATIALQYAKMGLFLRDGWNHTGALQIADIGLPDKAEPLAYLPGPMQLPKMVRNRHKYQAGYVVGFGGSKALCGAAKLSSLAALRAGAGLVRLFSLEEIGPAPLELICNRWKAADWKRALSKASAVFVGPGLGASSKSIAWLKTHLKQIQRPCVIDADALQPQLSWPKDAILTPHRGEALRLLGLKAASAEEELFAKSSQFCVRHQVTLVLKGAPTFIFTPHSKPVIIARGDPGMATAGAGDVLTGVIAALLAQGLRSQEAAVLGATLHAIAGEMAARANTSYCMIATDLIEFMPAAFRDMSETTR